jgi:hypothetical protein
MNTISNAISVQLAALSSSDAPAQISLLQPPSHSVHRAFAPPAERVRLDIAEFPADRRSINGFALAVKSRKLGGSLPSFLWGRQRGRSSSIFFSNSSGGIDIDDSSSLSSAFDRARAQKATSQIPQGICSIDVTRVTVYRPRVC